MLGKDIAEVERQPHLELTDKSECVLRWSVFLWCGVCTRVEYPTNATIKQRFSSKICRRKRSDGEKESSGAVADIPAE